MYQVTVQPASEPIRLSDIKSFLRIDWSDDDALLTRLIVSSRRRLEQRLGRAFITQTIRSVSYLPDFKQGPLSGPIGETYSYATELPMTPLQSVTTVEIENQIDSWTALTLTTDYLVDTSQYDVPRVFLSVSALSNWVVALTYPGQKPRVRTTYVAGYGDDLSSVPASITDTLFNMIAWLYENRGTGKALPEDIFDDNDRVYRLS